MTLTLTIKNVGSSLENGMPAEFVLHRRGATIGRAPTCDWALPDPHRYISSRHCEVSFRDNAYFMADVSTNGTFMAGSDERMPPERRIEQSDTFVVGHYEIVAELSGEAAPAPVHAAPVEQEPQGFAGWDSFGGGRPAAAAPASSDGWGAPSPGAAQPTPAPAASGGWVAPPASASPPATAASDGWGSASASPAPATGGNFAWGSTPASDPGPGDSGGWGPSHNAAMPKVQNDAGMWQKPEPAQAGASGWSSAAPDQAPAPSTDDLWGKISEGNVVDWARGGFGSAAPAAAAADPLGLNKNNSAAASFGAAPAAPRSSPDSAAAAFPAPRAASPPATAGGGGDASLADFLRAAGVDPARVKGTAPEVLQRGAGLLRRLISGMVVLVEARARAKSQMGAESTRLEFSGNNPIKFARTPEQALAQLLSSPERGFMESEKAIEDAFFDLQSHQVATLKAMQGALRATLDRFSPEAIRKRVPDQGLLKKLLPAARNAALWQLYEKDFGGVARGSDEAFMDVFAKEFRKAYDEANRKR